MEGGGGGGGGEGEGSDFCNNSFALKVTFSTRPNRLFPSNSFVYHVVYKRTPSLSAHKSVLFKWVRIIRAPVFESAKSDIK